MKKILYILLIAYSGLYAAPPTTPPTPVTVQLVQKQLFLEHIEALGDTYANESVDISSNVSEIIAEIHFDDGQKVKKEDVLVVLAQAEEKAQLESAKVDLAQKRREYNRVSDLVKKKLLSQSELDEALSAMNMAIYKIKELEAKIADRTIIAPFDGIVGLRDISLGALVQSGDKITTLDDINSIKLDFNVPDLYLAKIKKDLTIQATTAIYPDRVFEGIITTVNNRVDPTTRSITVRAKLNNENHLLKPGLLLQVSVITSSRYTLLIAEEALIVLNDKHYLLTVDNENKVVRKQVTIGSRQLGKVEIIQGLTEGERVITRGITRVRPGQTVSIKEAE